MRTPAYTEPTAEILRACIGRMLEKETWDYVKAHWLDKPWFPDPCREENVMFTGHLLQLIALYEAFTGDFRYRDPGFDFVWNTRTTVHYTVDRLVEATQRQMFANPSGGVAGEPDRVPFAGNANAQLGLALFERLGRGSWARERAKWERWAIRHFPNPVFGGGALSAAYRRSWRLMAPDGNPALDARGLLWYRPWAANARVPAALWRRAAAELDWRRFGSAPATNDAAAAEAATLVDAAARAYGDTSTAVRVEQTLEPCLERGGGSYSLRMDPAWRLGCTANRILALAFEHGSDFRRFLRGATFPGAGGGLALTAVSPAGCRVTEAYRAKDRLVLSFAGATEGGAELLLVGAPASIRVETVPERMPFEWHPGERRLVFRKVPRHIEISPRANE